MELTVPKRLWLGLIVSLALGFLLAVLFAPWANLLVRPANLHTQESHRRVQSAGHLVFGQKFRRTAGQRNPDMR